MANATISKEIKLEAIRLIEIFNQKTYKGSVDLMYIPLFKGKFLYLNRKEYDRVSPVARLTYTGDMKKWDFAIFKWSSELYDPEKWFFPGVQFAYGTIEGAMKAGMRPSFIC